jgi:hypothetical protein
MRDTDYYPDWTAPESDMITSAERELRRPFNRVELGMLPRPITVDKLSDFVRALRDIEDDQARPRAQHGDYADLDDFDNLGGWNDDALDP